MWWDAYHALASQPEQIGLSHDEWSHYVAVHTT